MIIVRLRERKETPLLNGHPWVFSGAIDRVDSSHEKNLCRVLDAKGYFVCQGFYNPYSHIAVRVLTLGKEPIGLDFFQHRIKRAQGMRERIIPENTNCYRLINGEGDDLPGLVVDVYGRILVMQFLCLGTELFKDEITSIFHALYPDHLIHERSDVKSRKAEGLAMHAGPLHGELPEGDIEVMENGIRLAVDIKTGDRTGFYMDHRESRARLRELAREKDVLDLFSYSGGFSLHALAGGAKSVVSVDSSAPAQAILKRTMELNGVSPFVWRHVKDDIFRYLNQETNRYDIVVCDPPPFAKAEEYVKVNTLAMEKVRPGGLLFTCVSYAPKFGGVDLLKTVNKAALTLNRHSRVIAHLSQARDYPFLASHPEGIHLHGFIVYVD